ncbi:MAG: NB-ARC domain-containing protein [Sphaerochaetaceae bacterium]|nr:NB-ARC domain-containing protein [Sphaerochaetaceae bacterium]
MNITRLTIFSIISAIEQDLREILIHNFHDNLNVILSKEQFDKFYSRLCKEEVIPREKVTITDLADYFDFCENIEIILSSKNYIDLHYHAYFKAVYFEFQKIFPIRNRIAHSRPILIEDYDTLIKTANSLILSDKLDIWNHLSKTLDILKKNPNSVFGIVIPNSFKKEDTIFNNLPLPDFDETGFIGRDQLVTNIKTSIFGSYPVFTLRGDGGIGKTALALKVAYDIMDDPKNNFDAIIWSSSKTTKLTPHDVKQIQYEIIDSIGLFRDIDMTLGGNSQDYDTSIQEILTYMTEFKILLIIDNLETVLDDRIRNFIGKIPSGSKVLITSRIGLGAYDVPIPVTAMDEKDAILLTRKIAKIRGIDFLKNIHNNKLKEYLKQMNFNPGYIKWFISAIQVGRRPEEVLANPDIFLDFCMSNVYNYLNEQNKKVLRSLLCLNTELGQADLAYINELDYLTLQKNISDLLVTNMFVVNSISHGSSFETKYCIPEFARNYLLKQHPVKNDEYRDFIQKKNQLISVKESMTNEMLKIDKYSIYYIHSRSTNDKIIVKYLNDAMKATKISDFSKASDLVEQAKDLAPDFFEVYRCMASINAAQGLVSAAASNYQTAINLEPKYSPLLYFYAGFLLKSLNDTQSSKKYYEKANKYDKNNYRILFELSRVNMFLGIYDEAMKQLLTLIKIDNLGIYQMRKVQDLFIQLNYRMAEEELEKRNLNQSMEYIKQAQEAYLKCPISIRDEQMLKTFRKCDRYFDILNYRISLINEKKDELQKIFDNLIEQNNKILKSDMNSKNTNNNSETGQIYKDLKPKAYGFIISDNGDTVFFHKNNFSNSSDWFKIKIGTLVSYNIFVNDDGKTFATDICIL